MSERVRSVSGTGSVSTNYDQLTISLSIKGHGTNTRLAKVDAKERLEAVKATIEELRENGVEIPDNKYVVKPTFEPHYRWESKKGGGPLGLERQERFEDGYSCKYSIKFFEWSSWFL